MTNVVDSRGRTNRGERNYVLNVPLFCVLGVSEGRPRNVLQSGEGVWFCTNETQAPAAWVELHLPPNVKLQYLRAYTFAHGYPKPHFYRYGYPRNSHPALFPHGLFFVFRRGLFGVGIHCA
jgi:hypothetical protein